MIRRLRFAAARTSSPRRLHRARLQGEALEIRQMLSVNLPFVELPAPIGPSIPVELAHLKSSNFSSSIGAISDVASDAAGNYVLLAYGKPPGAPEGATFQLYAQRYSSDNVAVGEPILIDEQEPLAPGSYRVAMHADGGFVVAWTLASATAGPNSQSRLKVQRFDSGGQAVGPEHLTSIAGFTAVVALDVTSAGGIVVGYRNQAPATTIVGNSYVPPPARVYLQRFDAAGQTLGTAIDLGQGREFEMSASGGQIVTLVADAEAGGHYFVQRFGYDGWSRGERVRLTLLDSGARQAALDMDDSGRFVVAWQQDTGAARRVLAQRFGRDAQPLGPVTLVASGDALVEQSAPLVAATGDGRFFVGWAGDHSQARGWIAIYSRIPFALKIQAFDATGQKIGDVFEAGFHEGSGMAQISAGGSTLAVTDYFPTLMGDSVGSDTFAVPQPLVVDLNGDPPGVDYKINFVPNGPAVPLVDTATTTIRGAQQIKLATISILDYRLGDTLQTSSLAGTNIQATIVGGVLTLSGLDSAANYAAAIRGLRFSTAFPRAAGETVEIAIVVNDGAQSSATALSKISIHVPGRSSIAGRHIFYNNSAFDAAEGSTAPAAVATDKVALLPDQQATAANHTSYTRGINGIFVDLAGAHGTISADDFIFRVGVSDDPESWTYAPAPLNVIVHAGLGAGGSNRVEIVWADGAIKNSWLQVVVLDNGDTGLAEPDIFFFGNQVGDTGIDTGAARVNALDAMAVINRLIDSQASREAAIDDKLDFDRDGRITALDAVAVINRLFEDDNAPLEMIEVAGESALDGAIITGGLIAMVASPVIYVPEPVQIVLLNLQAEGDELSAPDQVAPDQVAPDQVAPEEAPLMLEWDDPWD